MRFLKDNCLLGTKHLSTFSCNGFWSYAGKDDAWERAVRFLKDNCLLGTKHLATFSCGGFWSSTGDDDAWERAVRFLKDNHLLFSFSFSRSSTTSFFLWPRPRTRSMPSILFVPRHLALFLYPTPFMIAAMVPRRCVLLSTQTVWRKWK